MENLKPVNLATLCDILITITTSKLDEKKKAPYLRVKKIILNMFELDSLDEVKNYYSELKHTERVSWCLDTISKYELFSTISRLSMFVELKEKIDLGLLLTDLYNNFEKTKSKNEIKTLICYLLFLDVISLSCDNSEQVLSRHNDEMKILNECQLNKDVHKEIFFIILYCIEILNAPKNCIQLKFEDFNKDLYYSSSITYLNHLKDKIHQESQKSSNKVSNLYTKILEIVGLLIAIFSIIGVNCFTIASQSTIEPMNIIIVNASLAMSISLILFLIHNIIHEQSTKKYYIVFAIAFLGFLAIMLLNFIKNNIFILYFNT